MSNLPAVAAIWKEKCEILIKLSKYLEVDQWSKDMNFICGGS